MLREEVEETRQALAWREEELGKIRMAKAESEVLNTKEMNGKC